MQEKMNIYLRPTMWISRLAIVFGMLFVAMGKSQARYFDTVVIDPGHGGSDPGAYRHSVREKDLTLKVAKKLRIQLKARGINVVMTRSTDKKLSLEQRAAIANKYKNAIFVSIHFNAAEKGLEYVKGVETFYASQEGRKMASKVQGKMLKTLGVRDRKVKDKDFAVLEKTRCPAILVECGFISNYYERKRCSRSWYQSLCASSIAHGLLEYRRLR